jgi:hypothetical protein
VTGEAGLESGETHAKSSPSSTSELSYRIWGLIVGMFLSKLDLNFLSFLVRGNPAGVAIFSSQFVQHLRPSELLKQDPLKLTSI